MKTIKVRQVLDAKRLLAFAASFAAVVACADTYWDNQNGGDMATASNWTSGLPSNTNKAYIDMPASDPLTLSGDLNTGADIFIRTNITLNLGAERTLTANRTWAYRNSIVTLASGSWKVTDRFFVGDGYSDATFIVDGANSALYGSANQPTLNNYYIQVGNAGDDSGTSKSMNNLLLVRNGGLLQGGVIIGKFAKEGNELCGTNTFRVTGTGSRFISSHTFYIGRKQGLSQGIIDDHATATLSSNVSLGEWLNNSNVTPNRYYVGDQNRLLVSGGASLTATGNAYVGHTSASNLFEVADGAKVTVASLYASYSTNGYVRSGRAPFANRIVVQSADSSLTVNGSASLGYVRGSHDDSMLIANGASFAASSVTVGSYGHSSRLTVDGGVFSAQGNVDVGYQTSASNCVFEVLNGATATMQRLVFADNAPNCTAVISNATLEVDNYISYSLDLGYHGTSSNMTFVVAGRNGKVRASGGVRILNSSAKIAFRIPAEGFAETPFVVNNFLNVARGATIEVTADENWPCGSRQTLVELVNGQAFSAQVQNLALVCNDDRLRVIRTDDKIYVKKLGGFVITFR